MQKTRKLLLAGLLLPAMILLVLAIGGCGNSPVAMVNGKPISQKEFIDALLKTPQAKQTLSQLITDKLIEQKAQSLGLTVTDEEVQEKYDETVKQLGGAEKFKQLLEARGLDEAEVKRQIRQSLLAEKIATKDVKISDQEIKDYYNQHKLQLGSPEKADLSLIVLRNRKQAEQVLSKLKQGANFAELAQQVSVDSSAQRGGNIGQIEVERLPEQLKKAVRKLKPGQISDIIKVVSNTSTGPVTDYFIIQLNAHTAAYVPKLDDKTRKLIVERLKVQKGLKSSELMDYLTKGSKVVIVDDRFKDLETNFQSKDLFFEKEKQPQPPSKPTPKAEGK